MKMNILKSKPIINTLITALIVAFMVGISQITNQKEIIFPEIAAISIGIIIAPKRAWQTNKILVVGLVSICAVIGLLIAIFLPFPKWINMLIAYILAQIIFIFSKTSFAPMISAAVLPVLLETESIIYPISAFLLSLIIVAIVEILEKLNLKDKEKYIPLALPSKADYINVIMRSIIAGLMFFIALKFKFNFSVAPPLIVAFTEFSKIECKARTHPVKAVLLIFLCSFAGALSRGILCQLLNLPLTVAAIFAIILSAILIYSFKMYLPPAGALAILAMIIPQTSLYIYPIQILVGAAFLMIIALVIFRKKA